MDVSPNILNDFVLIVEWSALTGPPLSQGQTLWALVYALAHIHSCPSLMGVGLIGVSFCMGLNCGMVRSLQNYFPVQGQTLSVPIQTRALASSMSILLVFSQTNILYVYYLKQDNKSSYVISYACLTSCKNNETGSRLPPSPLIKSYVYSFLNHNYTW